MNRKDALAQASLPNLLFRYCHEYCCESEFFMAKDEAEQRCIKNCQERKVRLFDLYIYVRMHMDANKKYEHFVDVSKFTEMELKAGHDTTNQIAQKHGTHSLPRQTAEITDGALKQISGRKGGNI